MYKVSIEYKYPNDIDIFLDDEQYKIFSQLVYGENISRLDFSKKISLPTLTNVLAKKLDYFGNNESITYKDILVKVLKKNNIPFSYSLSAKDMEELFLKSKFKSIISNLSVEQKLEFDKQLKIIGEQEGLNSEQLKSFNTIGILTAANLSGFGMYIMASTVVGGVSGVLGVTLPFAFYTGMSSFLSFITGPIGWIFGLGYLSYTFRNDNLDSAVEKISNQFFALKKYFTGDYEYVETVVIFVASHRLLMAKKAIEFFEEQIKIGYYEESQNLQRKRKEFNTQIKTEEIEFKNKWSYYIGLFRYNYLEMLCSKNELNKIEKEYPFYKHPYKEIFRRKHPNMKWI